MAEMLKLGVVLMLVALVAAIALGLVNSRTAPIIAQQKELEKQNAMTQVAASLSPGDSLAFDSIAVAGLSNPYAMVDQDLNVVKVSCPPDTGRIGYLFIAYGKGYSSTVQTMVAVDSHGVVSGSTILYQQETPGLGANVVNPSKLIDRYIGRSMDGILLTKDGGEIDAMTGCTITSRAVTNSVRIGLEAMDEAGLFQVRSAIQNTGTEPPNCDPDMGADAPMSADTLEGGAE